jgi:hypothetical protein
MSLILVQHLRRREQHMPCLVQLQVLHEGGCFPETASGPTAADSTHLMSALSLDLPAKIKLAQSK